MSSRIGSTLSLTVLSLLLSIGICSLCAGPAWASGHGNREENVALLGVVTKPSSEGAKIVQVLEGSPAESAGLLVKDVLTQIGRTKIARPSDVDAALKDLSVGSRVKIGLVRQGKKNTTKARLVARAEYRGEALRRRPQGEVGFKAPHWFGYGWRNLPEGKAPPNRNNTEGKVVVLHCFQSV